MKYVKLFLTFMKIGFVGFGGGMAILPLIYQGVSKFIYISQAEFADLFGISQATPGPIAINAATFVGYKAGGVAGSLVATLGVVIPSFILVLLTSSLLKKHRDNALVEGAFVGIRPVTV
ncbi:MAG: chromate transporter, partial [Firmicutes bacterium]|nr:chromate transporter [Bacillota bacterium]